MEPETDSPVVNEASLPQEPRWVPAAENRVESVIP